MIETHDTVGIGGGQAGLAMSYYLNAIGSQHVVIERRRVAERWRSQRWDSLAFQFPNWALRLPGHQYRGDKPDDFAHHTEVTRFIEDYARQINAPLRTGIEVVSLTRDDRSGHFEITTTGAALSSRSVVLATGPFQRPLLPNFARGVPPDVAQLHASRYANPDQLVPGAALVVGCGGSGCQIAEELYQAGRPVFLAVGRHRRIPRRHRGMDLLWWLEKMGRFETTVDSLPNHQLPPTMMLSGAGGGHTIDLRRFSHDGVVLMGSLQGFVDHRAQFSKDLEENLRQGDKSYMEFQVAFDDYARTHGIDLDNPEVEQIWAPATPIQEPTELDLKAMNITTVLWCTGYQGDYAHLR